MTLFRFIQLSDIHLCIEPRRRNALALFRRHPSASLDVARQWWNGNLALKLTRPESYDPDLVAGVARFAWRHGDVTDCIIVSGDLATTGSQLDLATAKAFVDAAPNDRFFTLGGGVTLKAAHPDIHVMAGNHDHYRDDYGSPGGSAHFRLNFGNRMPNHDGKISHTVLTKNEETIGLIFADFTLDKSDDCSAVNAGAMFLRYGQGRVYPDVLKALIAKHHVLKQKYRNIHIVWVVHFAPFDCSVKLQLNDFSELVDAANSVGVQQLLCGHTHSMKKQIEGKLSIYCAGPAGAIGSEESSYIHINEIELTGGVGRFKRRNFLWSAARHDFDEQASD
ncbi:metallophosphoesterase [Mesorhizobium sp. M0478]|uniref:metallophosphoesterase n=1 Tax=Mesorhizobium sp. M0478 TaxID=2956947 RepID=UPI0033377B74